MEEDGKDREPATDVNFYNFADIERGPLRPSFLRAFWTLRFLVTMRSR